MSYRRLREQQIAEQNERRKQLFAFENHHVFEDRQKQRNRDNWRNQAVKDTDSLGLLVSKMDEQVQRSENTTTTLIRSSNVLKDTHGTYQAINKTIKVSGKTISKYARREFTDRILIALALCVYFGVVLYILRKRLPFMSYIF